MKPLSSLFFGIVVAAAIFAIGNVLAGSVTLFTGPAGTNPINFPADLADINALGTEVNTAIAPLSTGLFGTGWSTPNQVATQNATIGTLGPGIVTPSKPAFWITFTSSQGIPSFVPVWQ